MAIKILAYETGGAPKMLSSVDEIEAAIDSGSIMPGTRVTLYLSDDTSSNDRADAHPELAGYFTEQEEIEEEESTPVAEAPVPDTSKQSVWEEAAQRVTQSEAASSTVVSSPVRDNDNAIILPDRSTAASNSDRKVSPASLGRNQSRPRTSGNRRDEPDNFFGWMVRPYQLYATFEGRASRTEYWAFTLLVFIILVITVSMDSSTFFAIFMLGTVCPGLAVTIRRLHDAGLSGWLVLLALIPYIGGLILLVLTLLESKPEPNEYGPVPGGL